jgi:DNA-directed RNA polymerase subunit RPC12/RpoP
MRNYTKGRSPDKLRNCIDCGKEFIGQQRSRCPECRDKKYAEQKARSRDYYYEKKRRTILEDNPDNIIIVKKNFGDSWIFRNDVMGLECSKSLNVDGYHATKSSGIEASGYWS